MDSSEEVLYDEADSNSDESDENDVSLDLESESSILESCRKNREEYSYQVVTTDEVVKYMLEFIKDVNLVLEMPETVTRILLNHFNWDKQKLLERFYGGNQDKLFKEAHIVNPFNAIKKSAKQPLAGQSSSQALRDCEVCYESFPASNFTGLRCGHCFCRSCWNDYLKVKIMDDGIVQTIACPAHKCTIIVDDTNVMELLTDPVARSKYQLLITNSFVDFNKLMRWCPNTGCNRVIKVQYVDCKPVTCKCNTTFCFECGQNYHEPLSCKLLKNWQMKCNDDSETSKWIIGNTKPCPFCNTHIEKNGGCNHIRCTKCSKEFCWMCLENWYAHGYNQGCNVYNVQKDNDKEENRRQSRAAVEKYIFYSTRYMNHHSSLKFENELYINAMFKMEDMKEHNMSWTEVQFLKKSVDTLVSCRETLMFSYAYAYYLQKNNQTAIFEANQQDLEHAVEVLSGYLERDIATENLADMKQRVIDKSTYCDKRRQTLLEHVYEAQECDWWKIYED